MFSQANKNGVLNGLNFISSSSCTKSRECRYSVEVDVESTLKKMHDTLGVGLTAEAHYKHGGKRGG